MAPMGLGVDQYLNQPGAGRATHATGGARGKSGAG